MLGLILIAMVVSAWVAQCYAAVLLVDSAPWVSAVLACNVLWGVVLAAVTAMREADK